MKKLGMLKGAIVLFAITAIALKINAMCAKGTDPKTCYKKGDVIELKTDVCGVSCPERKVVINGDCIGNTCKPYTFTEQQGGGNNCDNSGLQDNYTTVNIYECECHTEGVPCTCAIQLNDFYNCQCSKCSCTTDVCYY